MAKFPVGARSTVYHFPRRFRRRSRPLPFGVDALILIAAGGLAMWLYTQMVAAGA